jgi:hypothetical protein
MPYQYSISPDGRLFRCECGYWLKNFFAAAPIQPVSGPWHSIQVFSRKNGRVAIFFSSKEHYPFYRIHFKQKHEIVATTKGVSRIQLVDGFTTITDCSGIMMTTTTYVQSLDHNGNYLEWKVRPTYDESADEPMANEWSTPELSTIAGAVAAATFSDDGRYLARLVGPKEDQIVIHDVNINARCVHRYQSTKIKKFGKFMALSPNNKVLALTCAAGFQRHGSTLLEACEIIDNGQAGLHIKRVVSYEEPRTHSFATSLVFSPDSTKLASLLPGRLGKIAVWGTGKDVFFASSLSVCSLPLLNSFGSMKGAFSFLPMESM